MLRTGQVSRCPSIVRYRVHVAPRHAHGAVLDRILVVVHEVKDIATVGRELHHGCTHQLTAAFFCKAIFGLSRCRPQWSPQCLSENILIR